MDVITAWRGRVRIYDLTEALVRAKSLVAFNGGRSVWSYALETRLYYTDRGGVLDWAAEVYVAWDEEAGMLVMSDEQSLPEEARFKNPPAPWDKMQRCVSEEDLQAAVRFFTQHE